MQPSLIQQRIPIDRQRLTGLLWLVFPGILVGLSLVRVVSGPIDYLTLAAPIAPLIPALLGVARLVNAHRRRHRFEALHGPDAGEQAPIR